MAIIFTENPTLKLGPNPTGQILYFFGARHTNNPADAQFNHLKKFWDEFLNLVKGKSEIFIEGATREVPQDYKEAIREYGESGAIYWLARGANIDVIRPEPSDTEQRKSLCDSFDPSIVAYTVMIQNLTGWFRKTGKTSFDEAIGRVLKREVTFTDIYGFMPNRSWFNEQHKKLFNDQKLEDREFINSISDPRKNNTIINEVVALRSRSRDEHILSVITETWRSGKSLFIVYGQGHLHALENSLRELVVS